MVQTSSIENIHSNGEKKTYTEWEKSQLENEKRWSDIEETEKLEKKAHIEKLEGEILFYKERISDLVPIIEALTGEKYQIDVHNCIKSTKINCHECLEKEKEIQTLNEKQEKIVKETSIKVQVLQEKVDHLETDKKKLESKVYIDDLTQAYNRRMFNELYIKVFNETVISYPKNNFSIALIDIDNFKEINDTYGHPEGDIVLKKIREVIQKVLTPYGKSTGLFRYGGEEFALLSRKDKNGIAKLSNRILEKLRATKIQLSSGEIITVTCSIGISGYDKSMGKGSETLIKSADKQLYLAKNSGKNKSCGGGYKTVEYTS